MRFAVIDRRASILVNDAVIDVAEASAGLFPSDAAEILRDWPRFAQWAEHAVDGADRRPLAADADFGAPSPKPSQVFGIGVNYADHAAESNMALPDAPLVFAKFSSSITGMSAALVVDRPTVDWEVELVVVIGMHGRDVTEATAWDVVAGLTVGQDFSDRALQLAGSTPQFNLGKSRPGYGPIGPWLVTPDEWADPNDLAISCTVNGEIVQQSRTGKLIHSVPKLIAYLSSILTLEPGDLIFTGTPAGVGFGRTPRVYLKPGDQVVGAIEGIGELRTQTVQAEPDE
jgi:2,4-diketo-3-deoxy-L-fuconate hydrolase